MPHKTVIESRRIVSDIYGEFSPMKAALQPEKEVKLMKSQLQDSPVAVTLAKRTISAAFPQTISINGTTLAAPSQSINYALGLLPGQQGMPIQNTVSPMIANAAPPLLNNVAPSMFSNGSAPVIANGTQSLITSAGQSMITSAATANAILNPAIATITGIPGNVLSPCGYQFPQNLSYQIGALQTPAAKLQQTSMAQPSAQVMQQLQAAQERSQALAYAQAVAQAEATAQIRARVEAEAEVQAQLRARVEEAHARAQIDSQSRSVRPRMYGNRKSKAIEVQTQTESPKPFQQYLQQAAILSQQKPTGSREFANPYEVYLQKTPQMSPTLSQYQETFSPLQNLTHTPHTSPPLLQSQLYQSANEFLMMQYQQQIHTMQNPQVIQAPSSSSPNQKCPPTHHCVTPVNSNQLNLPVRPASKTTNLNGVPSPPTEIESETLQASAYNKMGPHGNILYNQFLQEVIQLEQKMRDQANSVDNITESSQDPYTLRPPVQKRRKPTSPMRYKRKSANEN